MTEEFDCGRSLRRHAMIGICLGALLVGGVGGWATTTRFSGAVVAPGTLVVSSNLKKVQHPTGGVVGELRVRDGDHVRAGQVLARLDQTVTQANLAIVDKGLAEQFAKQARLVAEQDGAVDIAVPKLIQASFSGADANRVEGFDVAFATEVKLMQVRRVSRDGQKAQLGERIAQVHEQIAGLQQQVEAKATEAKFLNQELIGLRELWQKRMVEIGKLIPLERDASRLAGERGALLAEIAQAKGKITETQLQMFQVDNDLRTEVGKELADVRAKIAELVERKVAAEDQLARIEIRAPQDGIVHQLAVHTVGGVVTAGEPIMMIVPEADTLEVETKVNPQDIDQIRSGQKAVLRFPAFNQRTTPEVDGIVNYVAADLSTDQKSGATFYTARVAIPSDAVARLGGSKLVPGMPVESFVQTTDRTVISYLTKPLMDQVNRAFREAR